MIINDISIFLHILSILGLLTSHCCDCFRYLFGEPVQGTAYVVFGVKINKQMTRLPSVKQVSDVSQVSIPEFTRHTHGFMGAVMKIEYVWEMFSILLVRSYSHNTSTRGNVCESTILLDLE